MPPTQTNLAWETLFDLAKTRPGPLHQRLAEAIRAAVRDGRLPLGAALPPSRALAGDLAVSRWTVTQAYGQLITEGYLSGKTGSATRVNWSPEPAEQPRQRPAAAGQPAGGGRRPAPAVRYDLAQGSPDYRAFPRRKWVDSIRIAAETASHEGLGYAEAGGERRLRKVLAAQLDRRRGTHADPALMTLFTGARQSMTAVCRALAEDGVRRIGVEDPGSTGLHDAARAAGLELVGIPVDEHGARVEELERHPGLRAICVEPAHQAPTGALLSPERRAALLAWAQRVDGLIIEDDYDSEFSYRGAALPAMQGSDPNRVALIGSMSRTMTASVNVGWAVVPRRHLAAVRAGQQSASTSALNQTALAHFLESGEYDRHLRSLRLRLRARHDALMAALAERLPECTVRGGEAGVHFLLELPPGAVAGEISEAAEKRGMVMCDLNSAWLDKTRDEGRLQIGYGNLPDRLVTEAVDLLAELVHASAARHAGHGGGDDGGGGDEGSSDEVSGVAGR